MNQTKRLSVILSGFALVACFTAAGFLLGKSPDGTKALADTGLTTVPDSFLQSDAGSLSDENAVIIWSNTTATLVHSEARFTPTTEYTMQNVTDIAFRLRSAQRGTTTSTTSNGLAAINVKFKESDTTWNLIGTQQSSYLAARQGASANIYTDTGIAGASSALPEVGGYLSYGPNYNATVYLPLEKLYSGNKTTDADKLTAQEGYQSWTLEYIQFSVNSGRWDLAVGDIALISAEVNESGETTYSSNVLSFTKEALPSRTGTNNCTIIPLALTDKAGGSENASGIQNDGASIRYYQENVDDGGIRFRFSMKKSLYEALPDTAKVGVLLIPKDLAPDGLSVSTGKVLNITATEGLDWTYDESAGTYVALVTLYKIPSASYSRLILSRVYVSVTESNGDTETFYGDTVTRSIAYVAQQANNDANTTEAQKRKLLPYLPVVTLSCGEESGESVTESLTVTLDGSPAYTLPTAESCSFTAPEGKVLTGWSFNRKTYQPGESVSIHGNCTFTAIYEDIPAAEEDGSAAE